SRAVLHRRIGVSDWYPLMTTNPEKPFTEPFPRGGKPRRLRLDIRRVIASEIRFSKRLSERTTGLEPATFGLGSRSSLTLGPFHYSPLEIRGEHPSGLALVAGHQVPVAVERHGDARMAHIGRERLGIDAGGDHEGGVGVAALVKADRDKLCLLPGRLCAPHERLRAKRLSASPTKDKLTRRAGGEQPLRGPVRTQRLGQ